MPRSLLLIVLVLSLFTPTLALATPPSPPAPIPMRDFFRHAEKTGFDLSPSGKYLAFGAPYQNRLNVFVQPRAGGPAVRLTSVTDRDLDGFGWKGDDRIYYSKDQGGDENFHIYTVGRDGAQPTDRTPFPKVRAEIVDVLRDSPNELLITLNQRDPEVFDVFRLNVVTGALTLVAKNPGKVLTWATDHAGKLRIAISSEGVTQTLLYRANESAEWTTLRKTSFRDTFEFAGFTPDNQRLYMLSNLGRDKAALTIVDPATGKETAVVFEHPEVDVGGIGYSRARKVSTFVYYETWHTERKFLDPATEALYKKLAAKLPRYEVTPVSYNDAEDTFVVYAGGDRGRGAYYLYETASDKLTLLATLAPWLDEARTAEMKPISYVARDGVTIHGYLTVPAGSTGKNLPMILHPHGGPWARDEWGWDPEVQFLASRGYAVLQPNYRGSTGYGRQFWVSSFKQWGKAMQDDLSDGVAYAVKAGIADPKRVCIYGASYGGYATLAGMAFTPELYACGIDYVGVSNLFTFLKTAPPYWKPAMEMFYEEIGDPIKDKALLEAASPVFHVDRIRAPLFVVQGAQDPRVNINESNQMVEALHKRGIEVPYMVKQNEGHGFHNEENQFELYEAIEKFLAKHLTPPSLKR